MNDLELAEEIARGDLVIAAANPQHRYVPLEIKAQIIAALRRGPERPPSGEMVMVSREPTQKQLLAGLTEFEPTLPHPAKNVRNIYRAMLSAAEAEVRKPCPLCGRTDNHTHISGPFGMT